MFKFSSLSCNWQSLIVNLVIFVIIILGWVTQNFHLSNLGYYAFSGAVTNWLAIHMLFEKVPFLYGSGIIPKRFEHFKEGIKHLVMEQFFTLENIERFFKSSTDLELKNINLRPLIESLDYTQIFQMICRAIMNSPLGSMVSLLGGEKALEPLEKPFSEELQKVLSGITESKTFQEALAHQTSFFHPEKVKSHVEIIVEKRLDELTPKMVKIIVQNMIERHLGWLVVWGGVFGGLIGFIVSFLH